MFRTIRTILVLLVLVWPAAQAQTAEQMQMLENLSPEQRAQVLEQMGIEAPVAEQPPEFPSLVLDRSLSSLEMPLEPEEPRLSPGSSLVLSVEFPEELSARDREEAEAELAPRLQALLGSSAFELDRDGMLVIDDFYHIPLGGLTAEEAAIRVGAEPGFRGFEI